MVLKILKNVCIPKIKHLGMQASYSGFKGICFPNSRIKTIVRSQEELTEPVVTPSVNAGTPVTSSPSAASSVALAAGSKQKAATVSDVVSSENLTKLTQEAFIQYLETERVQQRQKILAKLEELKLENNIFTMNSNFTQIKLNKVRTNFNGSYKLKDNKILFELKYLVNHMNSKKEILSRLTTGLGTQYTEQIGQKLFTNGVQFDDNQSIILPETSTPTQSSIIKKSLSYNSFGNDGRFKIKNSVVTLLRSAPNNRAENIEKYIQNSTKLSGIFFRAVIVTLTHYMSEKNNLNYFHDNNTNRRQIRVIQVSSDPSELSDLLQTSLKNNNTIFAIGSGYSAAATFAYLASYRQLPLFLVNNNGHMLGISRNFDDNSGVITIITDNSVAINGKLRSLQQEQEPFKNNKNLEYIWSVLVNSIGYQNTKDAIDEALQAYYFNITLSDEPIYIDKISFPTLFNTYEHADTGDTLGMPNYTEFTSNSICEQFVNSVQLKSLVLYMVSNELNNTSNINNLTNLSLLQGYLNNLKNSNSMFMGSDNSYNLFYNTNECKNIFGYYNNTETSFTSFLNNIQLTHFGDSTYYYLTNESNSEFTLLSLINFKDEKFISNHLSGLLTGNELLELKLAKNGNFIASGNSMVSLALLNKNSNNQNQMFNNKNNYIPVVGFVSDQEIIYPDNYFDNYNGISGYIKFEFIGADISNRNKNIKPLIKEGLGYEISRPEKLILVGKKKRSKINTIVKDKNDLDLWSEGSKDNLSDEEADSEPIEPDIIKEKEELPTDTNNFDKGINYNDYDFKSALTNYKYNESTNKKLNMNQKHLLKNWSTKYKSLAAEPMVAETVFNNLRPVKQVTDKFKENEKLESLYPSFSNKYNNKLNLTENDNKISFRINENLKLAKPDSNNYIEYNQNKYEMDTAAVTLAILEKHNFGKTKNDKKHVQSLIKKKNIQSIVKHYQIQLVSSELNTCDQNMNNTLINFSITMYASQLKYKEYYEFMLKVKLENIGLLQYLHIYTSGLDRLASVDHVEISKQNIQTSLNNYLSKELKDYDCNSIIYKFITANRYDLNLQVINPYLDNVIIVNSEVLINNNEGIYQYLEYTNKSKISNKVYTCLELIESFTKYKNNTNKNTRFQLYLNQTTVNEMLLIIQNFKNNLFIINKRLEDLLNLVDISEFNNNYMPFGFNTIIVIEKDG